MTNRVTLVTLGGTFLDASVTFASAAARCLLGLAVSGIYTFGSNGMGKKTFYLSLAYPLYLPPRALLPWPAYWPFVPPWARVLLGLALPVLSSAGCFNGPPGFPRTFLAVQRRRTGHALFCLQVKLTGRGSRGMASSEYA